MRIILVSIVIAIVFVTYSNEAELSTFDFINSVNHYCNELAKTDNGLNYPTRVEYYLGEGYDYQFQTVERIANMFGIINILGDNPRFIHEIDYNYGIEDFVKLFTNTGYINILLNPVDYYKDVANMRKFHEYKKMICNSNITPRMYYEALKATGNLPKNKLGFDEGQIRFIINRVC